MAASLNNAQNELVNFLCEEVRNKSKPVRSCALQRVRGQEDELLRFVLDPEKRVVADLKRKLPGRGVWITATREAVAKAVRQKIFTRSFRQAVCADEDLAETVEILLRRAALQDLALANKAGCVVAGFVKVEKALTAGKDVVLLHATEASDDGRRKLDRLAKQRPEGLASITCFTSGEVSAVLGRTNVMHAAITKDGAGRRFIWSAERLIRYAGTHPGAAPGAETPEQDKA